VRFFLLQGRFFLRSIQTQSKGNQRQRQDERAEPERRVTDQAMGAKDPSPRGAASVKNRDVRRDDDEHREKRRAAPTLDPPLPRIL